MAEASGYI
ncbi:hypothetical protein N7519_008804 [Penicillium mononematosum]|nr:hypothetical protein N7519_008804 [Penicillium mononematosum]